MADDDRSTMPGRWRIAAAIGALLVVVGGVAAIIAGIRDGESTAAGPSCPSTQYLQVSAAPEMVASVRSVVERLHQARQLDDIDPRCPVPVVTPTGSADLVEYLRTNAAGRPDVWIADSSLWLTRLAAAGVQVPPGSPVLARSPVVLAEPVTDSAGARPGPGWDAVLPPVDAPPGQRLALPQAARSVTTMAALVELRRIAATRPTGAADFTRAVRSAQGDLPMEVTLPNLDAAGKAKVAVPTTEQQVFAGASGRQQPVRARYPADAAAHSKDYPVVMLTTDPARQARVAKLVATLQGPAGQAAFRSAGFRDAAGAATSELRVQPLVDADRPAGATLESAAAAAAVLGADRILKGSQVLVVIDISGSMALPVTEVPGAARIDLAQRAAVAGLATYPDDTKAGLWVFSTDLTPGKDHQVLVPLGPLGARPEGTTGRQLMAQGLASVRPKPDGSTGLYDTILAAVREVRVNWDPQKVSSVILITDGANEDPNGISLQGLVDTLRTENNPDKPVPLFVVAYGPQTDLASLEQIIQVTGGKAYAVRDARTVGGVIADAIGQRATG